MAELSFGVKIWGEISQFLKALNQGKDGMKDFEKGAVSSFKGLSDQVKAAEMKFKNLAATMGINSPEARQALAGLTAIKEKYNDINKAAANAGKNEGLFSGLKGELLSVGAGFFAASTLVDGFTNAIKASIEGALEDERAEKKLTFALNGSAAATQRMLRFKDQMWKNTLFTEDEIMAATSMGLALGRTEIQTKKLVETAMGLANVTGVDLNTAMMQLSATYEGNTGKLGKLESEVKGLTEEQLRNGDAVEILNKRYGKFASEGLHTTSGELIQLKKYLAETGESFMSFFMKDLAGTLAKFQIAWKTFKAATGLFGGYTFESNASGKEQIQSTWDNIAAMREQAKLDQNRNLYLEKLNAQQEKKVKITKDETDSQIVLNSVLKQQKALLEGTLVGPHAGMTYGDLGDQPEITHIEPKKFGGFSGPKQYIILREDPNALAKKWTDAISSIQGALGGLSGSLQSVFAGLSEFLKQNATGFKEGWVKAAGAIGTAVQGVVGFITELFTQQSNRRLSELDAQTEKEREAIQNSRMSEESKAKALDALDKQSAKKRKELMRQQAKDQKIASLMQAVVAGALAVVQAFSAGPGIGIALGVITAALVAAQIATIVAQPLPALASGGLAYAPTMAMVGDNPNARIDPEVIAPLSKLRGMLGGSEQGQLVAVVRGDDLKFILDRANRNGVRKYGG